MAVLPIDLNGLASGASRSFKCSVAPELSSKCTGRQFAPMRPRPIVKSPLRSACEVQMKMNMDRLAAWPDQTGQPGNGTRLAGMRAHAPALLWKSASEAARVLQILCFVAHALQGVRHDGSAVRQQGNGVRHERRP